MISTIKILLIIFMTFVMFYGSIFQMIFKI